MLPEKVLIKDKLIPRLLPILRKYAHNHKDKFCLVAVPQILEKLMDVVIRMSNEELHEGDWWVKGFKSTRISSQTQQHSGLLKYAREIAEEIYERQGHV